MIPPPDTILQTILSTAKTIAIIGAKDKPNQPVDMVGRYLIAAGYIVIPVNPNATSVWGLACYPSINDVPLPIDIINVFRASPFCAAHAHEATALINSPKAFWMQKGIESNEAVDILYGSTIIPIWNRCIMVEHQRLFPYDI